jgi:RNA polymerase sigma factor (sigma-70 family)
VQIPPFQTLLDAHGRDVHRFLIATVGRNDADDCYQETWIAALRAYPGLVEASNLRSWILTIAHHKAIDHIRARGRRAVPAGGALELESVATARPSSLAAARESSLTAARESSLTAARESSLTAARESSLTVARAGSHPPASGASAATLDADGELWQLVRSLPDKQRTAVALRFLADAAYAEISKVMETTEEAARRNVHEGLKRLRTEYQP